MSTAVLPLLLFAVAALLNAVAMLAVGYLFGPRRSTPVKQMPYESGMDPIHDARRRFDVRFHLVAVAFLLFDVELLFLYPWAVAAGSSAAKGQPRIGIDWAVAQQWVCCRGLVFAEAMVFIILLALGLVYIWRRGVLQWR
jgi:NADH-quinone oxidoreductase subunit A